MTGKILLKYSRKRAEKPILATIIRETDVPINILHADLTAEGGEIFISIEGPEDKINEAVKLFKKYGVKAEEVKEAIQLDEESCIDCGACISLCPTDALSLDKDYSLVLDEEKCVYCEICIPACPVRALDVRKIG